MPEDRLTDLEVQRTLHLSEFIKVTLTDTEAQIATGLGSARDGINISAGVKNKQLAEREGSKEINVIGTGGELAFCKAFNLYPDLTVAAPGRYPKGDARMFGQTWDIKTRNYEKMPIGHLLSYPKPEEKRCDNYALVLETHPTYYIIGWCSTRELFDEKNRLPHLKGGYGFPQLDLHLFNPALVHYNENRLGT